MLRPEATLASEKAPRPSAARPSRAMAAELRFVGVAHVLIGDVVAALRRMGDAVVEVVVMGGAEIVVGVAMIQKKSQRRTRRDKCMDPKHPKECRRPRICWTPPSRQPVHRELSNGV